jgi:hypothetical protein
MIGIQYKYNLEGGKEMENDSEILTGTDTTKVLKRLDDALKTYKLSEIYASDVSDDYGKKKIASLRLEFAKHELLQAMDEAAKLGVETYDKDFFKNIFIKN